jgi:hypothetical protein
MQESFDQNIQELENRVRQALAVLEQQTYVQRNDDTYEYLTEEEQDVENEIKNTNVENDEIYKVLEDIFFTEILRDSKIRYEDNQQDYAFAKRIDGKQRGKDHEMVIDIITPYNQFSNQIDVLRGHSMGEAHLQVVLPQDAQFIQDVLMTIRTDTYVKQHHGVNNSETKNAILASKGSQNSLRKKNVSRQAADLVSRARFFASGDEVEVGGEDAKTRIVKAFNLLIAKIYPHLRMLGKVNYSENDIHHHLEHREGGLFSGEEPDMTEAETEMFTFINNAKLKGERASMKKLEDNFSTRPYGWYLAAIQCVVAQLVGRGKLEAWQEGNLLENGPLEKALRNTYGFNSLSFETVKTTDPRVIQALKEFHQDFFNEPTSDTEVRKLTSNLQNQAQTLQDKLKTTLQLANRYPFLAKLEEPVKQLGFLQNQGKDFFTDVLPNEMDVWLDLKENQIDPLLTFVISHKREIYDELLDFTTQKKADLSPSQLAKLQAFLDDPNIYADNRLQKANVELTEIKVVLREELEEQRQRALAQISQMQTQMQQMHEYQVLNPARQEEADGFFESIAETIKTQELAVSIRDKVNAFGRDQYPRILTRLHELAAENNSDAGPQRPEGPAVAYIHIREIPVERVKPILVNEADVEEYIEAFRTALLDAIHANKRINL